MSNHGSIKSLLQSVGFERELPPPCCVASEMTSQSVLYVDSNGVHVLKNYRNMSVRRCACVWMMWRDATASVVVVCVRIVMTSLPQWLERSVDYILKQWTTHTRDILKFTEANVVNICDNLACCCAFARCMIMQFILETLNLKYYSDTITRRKSRCWRGSRWYLWKWDRVTFEWKGELGWKTSSYITSLNQAIFHCSKKIGLFTPALIWCSHWRITKSFHFFLKCNNLPHTNRTRVRNTRSWLFSDHFVNWMSVLLLLLFIFVASHAMLLAGPEISPRFVHYYYLARISRFCTYFWKSRQKN